MWYMLWIIVLFLVHLQFKYCGAFAVGFLKIVETTLIVGAAKIYMDYDTDTLYSMVESIPQYKFPIPSS